MDPTRDNPVIRCTTFWWGCATFLFFGVLLAAILMTQRQPPTSLEAAAAEARYVTKARILKAEADTLSMQEIEAAIPKIAAELPTRQPRAVEKPEQVVPGSPTARKLAAEPAVPGSPNGVPVAAPPAANPPAAPASPAESGKP
jgi:hypothetical protein